MNGYIKKIDKIEFGLMSPDDIREMSVITVETPDTYEDDGFPIAKGLMDPKMGVVDPRFVCQTCGFRGGECQGHFGRIELARPVIHIGFGDVIHKILRSVCNECGRILLDQDTIEEYREKIEEGNKNISDILKELLAKVKNVEMKDDKQEEIVKKIMIRFFPEGVDGLDYYEIRQVLIEISRVLFTEAYIKEDKYDSKEYIDSKYLCPHCKKNSSLVDIEATFENIELEQIQREIDSIFNFNKIFSSKNPNFSSNNSKFNEKLEALFKKLNELFESSFPENRYVREMKIFESTFKGFKSEIAHSKNIENSISIYTKVLNILYDDVLKRLNISKDNVNAENFDRYIKSVEDANSFSDKILEVFEEDKAKQVRIGTKEYVKAYLQKLIQEPIGLDKPVTIRQGDYKLTAAEVREKLERISDEDSYVLGVNPELARPEWMVLTVLPVPPVTVRPSITLDTGERSESDLTHKLVDILRMNQRLLENMEAGAPDLIIDDLWELLQYHVTTYFDNEASGVPPARHRSGRPLKTLTQGLKGKEGRFRSNLSGKRVNFSARSVISPDPNIGINEVGVPEMIAKEVTVPVYVTEWNLEHIKKYIRNGPRIHPGANYVIRTDGRKIRVRNDESIEFILEHLEPGFIVERHLIDGDIVLLNRQPSLHRMSMLAHEVRILPYKTFRINPCVCPPYNADFDGDEMNMHIFQTVESRAEAKSLLRVQEHILSPRFGGPIIGAIHDHISGAFLLTREGSEFSEEEALQIIRKSHLKIPKFEKNQWVLKYDPEADENSFIYKEKGDKWTGKELFSLTLPNDLNLEYESEIAKGKEQIIVSVNETGEKVEKIGYMGLKYPTEGHVVIRNGILEQGVIDESAFAPFSGKILDKIVKEYGSGRAKEFLDRATDLAICGIMKTGITTSLNDEEIPEQAQDYIDKQLDKAMDEVDSLVEAYGEGYLQVLPGRNLEESLEMKIMQVLGEARDLAGEIAEEYILNKDDTSLFSVLGNNSAVMAKTGARASMLNLTQISACVGQQAIRGGRIERGYLGRTLPHFKKGELGAKAKGFVHSSYKSGLDPIEFFFHAMGGREGLVDTAIRTAQSGYMQRRLVNALLDLQVDFNGVVKDNDGHVLQTLYGEDGVDPAKSDFGRPADLNKLIEEIRMNEHADTDSSVDNIYSKYIFDESLSDDEVNKLIIKSNNLIKRLTSAITDYRNFERKISFELQGLEKEYADTEFGDISVIVHNNYLELVKDKKQCTNLNKLDEIKDDLKDKVDSLKEIRKTFENKLLKINELKREQFNNSLEKYNQLISLTDSLIINNLNDCSALIDRVNGLIDNASNLNDYINDGERKESLLDSLEHTKEELLQESDKINAIEDQFQNYKSANFESYNEIDAKTSELNEFKEDIDRSFGDDKFNSVINEHDKSYQELYEIDIKIEGNGEINSQIKELNKCLNHPFIAQDLRKFNLTADEQKSIRRNIIEDCINQKIVGENLDFKMILISYYEEYSKNSVSLSNEELDEILSDVDYSNVDQSIVEECRDMVKMAYESKSITKNQIPIKFNNLIDKKRDEIKKLDNLDGIRNNPNLPVIKQFLSEDDCDSIYLIAEEKICSEYGLRGSVITFVEQEMYRKNEKNKSEARDEFKRLRYNRKRFLELTNLGDEQVESFVRDVELLIGDNRIKTDDFDEEFIRKLSLSFRTYGKVML